MANDCREFEGWCAPDLECQGDSEPHCLYHCGEARVQELEEVGRFLLEVHDRLVPPDSMADVEDFERASFFTSLDAARTALKEGDTR